MKVLLYIFISVFFLVSASAQDISGRRRSGRAMSDLNGPVNTIVVESRILEAPENTGLSGWLNSRTVFDRDGEMLNFVVFDDKGEITETAVFETDANGRKTKESRIRPDGTPMVAFIFRYDGGGNQTETDVLGANGAFLRGTRRTFDEKGKMTSFADLEENGAIGCTTGTVFDDKGNWLKESRRCQREWAGFDSVNDYAETENGKRIETRIFSTKGILTSRYVYETDKNGNQTDLKYEGQDNLREKETFEYSGRDSHGNWTTEIRTFWKVVDGTLTRYGLRKTTRTIKYF